MEKPILSPITLRVFQEYLVSSGTVRGIEELFEDAGIYKAEGYDPQETSVRRAAIKQYYASVDLSSWLSTRKLLKVYEDILLSLHDTASRSSLQDSVRDLEKLVDYLKRDGFTWEDNQIRYPANPSILTSMGSEEYSGDLDLFELQFPAGLPFGRTKPEFVVAAHQGRQRLQFQLRSGMGLLQTGVYPNLDVRKLGMVLAHCSQSSVPIGKMLAAMCQTPLERQFLGAYLDHFGAGDDTIPAMVPQAWVQWHSMPKKNLRAEGSSHSDELYRIDFVAFWNDQRYAILVDDISHYAQWSGNSWVADQEAYSKRLKEDRKLRKEQWQVFRISNWEVRSAIGMPEILGDLKDYIGF